jgi:PAS domain S-box-containing protein
LWVCETINPACEQITGLRAADCVGRNACELTPNSVPEALAAAFRSCQTGKEVVTREHPLDLPAGQRWFNTVLVPLSDGNGAVRRIACIARDITDHRRNEEAVRRLNAELEARVAQRTSQLADANKELEAFSYSVSHDLRAPLRSIDGFSKALLEDYADRLDAEGQDYLRRVRAASQRMGDLIDDLLDLSRINRAELRRARLDLGVIARKIADGLHTGHPERAVEWSIAPSLGADGDRNLLTILLDNLLGNAFKYTGRRPAARIEVGGFDDNGRMVYFVKDDGAGFDMTYAQKLFQPFQRLHLPDEFDGHGIGLATVQRIVRRHGGRVWAEAAVERGACFYFTLENPPTGELSLE